MSDLSMSDLSLRRGACPTLSTPMQSGDGLLVRLSLTDWITPEKLARLARAADRYGNGLIDISARGSLQVWGLDNKSLLGFQAEVQSLELPLGEGLAVETPPLAGIDRSEVADPRPVAEAIREGARDIAGLAPKMSVIVDGAGRLRLSDLIADIRLVAVKSTGWRILLGGTEREADVLDVLPEAQAVHAVIGVLRQLASIGSHARGRDLQPRSQISVTDPRMSESVFGLHALSDGLSATGIGPAFGQCQFRELIMLCDEAIRLGITSVMPAYDRSLLFLGLETACRALSAFAEASGFITSAQDRRSQVAVCAGQPACRSASIDMHEIANQAVQFGDLLDGSFKLHISGCAKGCAHPKAAAVVVRGADDRVCLIASGKATEEPFASVEFADTNAALHRLSDLVRSERRKGENSAACLARLGSERLAQAAMSGRV